ncbi:MAG: SGNH/GDSL hydrolase family protein [Candidatus Nanopelagicales bacterium]
MTDRASAPPWRRYVALGDSFTEGLQDEVGPDGRHRGWADRLAGELDARSPGLTYANLAVRGRLLPQVVDEQVPAALALDPDLVTFAAGVNDALRRHFDLDASATLLEDAVRRLRAGGADVLLVAFGDPSRRSRAIGSVTGRIAAYDSVVRAVAERYGCYLMDFWGLAAFDDDVLWDEDRLHLAPEGHRVVAAAALDALGFGDDRWRTPRAPSPHRPLPARVAADAAWARGHLLPWLGRRLRGISSGDGVDPKRPTLAPVDIRI